MYSHTMLKALIIFMLVVLVLGYVVLRARRKMSSMSHTFDAGRTLGVARCSLVSGPDDCKPEATTRILGDWSMVSHYRLLFGLPDRITRMEVESGEYPVTKPYGVLADMQVGDKVLLYCSGGYPGWSKVVWGSGEITKIDYDPSTRLGTIYYAPRRFGRPVLRATMLQVASGQDGVFLEKATRPWIVSISEQTYQAVCQVGLSSSS
jgi:hypothetical protein